ncbi:MAG TPA: rRNA maturation RNase YbeY [Candidatus Baltobacteraceae bacterium]|nr:rRNA maturation RNase YbeY [Candidatus Baltobacteraceae bacterium]
MIYFRSVVKDSGVDTRRLKSVAKKLLREVDEPDSALSLSLVDDREIQQLNREHRGKDKPTDVLSFPLYEPGEELPGEGERLLGDVVISVDTARRQAAGYDAPLQNELYRLLIHGILHVMGHDHEQPAERAAMEAEERRLAAAIGMPWPYDEHARV